MPAHGLQPGLYPSGIRSSRGAAARTLCGKSEDRRNSCGSARLGRSVRLRDRPLLPVGSREPRGHGSDVLTVEFTVLGVPCLGLNGGPAFKHSEAFSFQVATDDQHETDRYWNAIVGNGGQESDCGWCKDRWGLSWQITPRTLTEAMAAGGAEAKRAFEAMMQMQKIDVATIDAARRG